MDAEMAIAVNARNYLRAIGDKWKGAEKAGEKVFRSRKSLRKAIRNLRQAGHDLDYIVSCAETKLQAIVVQDFYNNAEEWNRG